MTRLRSAVVGSRDYSRDVAASFGRDRDGCGEESRAQCSRTGSLAAQLHPYAISLNHRSIQRGLIYIVVSKIADRDKSMQPALQPLSDKMSPRFMKTLSPAFVASLSYYPFAQALRRYHPS